MQDDDTTRTMSLETETGCRVVGMKHSTWLSNAASCKNHWRAETIVAMPWIDRERALGTARLLTNRAGAPMLLLALQDDTRVGPVKIWNDVLASTSGSFFVYLADDAFPGRGWLRRAIEKMQAHRDGHLLAFNDGKWFGELAGFGLARREWLDHVYDKALFHPGYRRHFGDTELTLIARQQSALLYEPDALLVEVDMHKDRKSVDEQDRRLFEQRKNHGFDGRVQDRALLARFA
jgi:hypothetical protein